MREVRREEENKDTRKRRQLIDGLKRKVKKKYVLDVIVEGKKR
jgi:hypothetical protein